MHDAFDAGDDFLDRAHVGEIGSHEVIMGGEIVRLADIAPADVLIDRGQQLAHARADAAGRSGNKNFLHRASRECRGGVVP